MESKDGQLSDIMVVLSICRDGSGCLYTVIQWKASATVLQGLNLRMELAKRKYRLHTRQC